MPPAHIRAAQRLLNNLAYGMRRYHRAMLKAGFRKMVNPAQFFGVGLIRVKAIACALA
jgi:hypothetical protein